MLIFQYRPTETYCNNAGSTKGQHPDGGLNALAASFRVDVQALHCCKGASSIRCVISSMRKALQAGSENLHITTFCSNSGNTWQLYHSQLVYVAQYLS